jgi:transcriptional repressor NrdR
LTGIGVIKMRCPFCSHEDTRVIDSRPSEGKKRRRRECPKCGRRFTTYEVVEKPLLMVYKKDGSFEPFDRQKLIKGLQNAIKKRPVSVEQVTNLVDDIENTYANKMQTETTTGEIGDMVLSGLKKLDNVAYVRFASVYKDFNDVDSFIQIISELSEK